MAEFITTPGLLLPVLVPGTEIIRSKERLRAAAASGQATVVRSVITEPVRIDRAGILSLDELLEVADEQFRIAAGFCDATVVHHDWGFNKNPGRRRFEPNKFLPPEYELVAEVNLVQQAVPLEYKPRAMTTDSKIVDSGLMEYLNQSRSFKWDDAGVSQFVATGDDPYLPNKRYLVDIEPRISYM